jgi:hypothetical protein
MKKYLIIFITLFFNKQMIKFDIKNLKQQIFKDGGSIK